MIEIIYSDRLTALADELIAKIGSELPSDPLEPVTILVPNRETARWLTLRIAEREGIAANIRFRLPSEWMWEEIRHLYNGLPDLLPSERGPMSWAIYELLGREEVVKRFPVLQSYLVSAAGNTPETLRHELSVGIASVFDKYQVYRPEMLLEWEKGGFYGPVEEQWQKELWLLVTEYWEKGGGQGSELHRPALYEGLRRYLESGSESLQGIAPLFLFNTGRLSRPFLGLIASLSERREVRLFNLLPTNRDCVPDCGSELLAGFRGESETNRELIREFFTDTEPVWLPGRPLSVENWTNLALIQNSVISNRPFPKLVSIDGTIDIRSCHSALREVEVLYEKLQELFSGESAIQNLLPEEVAVVMPDLELYVPYIESVFGSVEEERLRIPYHLASGNLTENSGYIAVFIHLLRIAGSRFTLEEILEFLHHRAVCESFRFTDSDIRQIRQWFAGNNVFWGIDGDHRRELGQPSGDLQTWQSAFQRGWAGQLAGGEAGEFLGGTLLYHGADDLERQQLWARFQRLFDLLVDFREEVKQSRSCEEWAELFTSRAERFLPGGDSDSGERKRLRDCIESIRKESSAAGFHGEVPFHVVRQSLISKLAVSPPGSVFFTRGVIFSSMLPLRSIPFRVIALIGLNDDLFPRKQASPEFDLIARHPEHGERDRKSEDRNLFLESVLAAGELHYCSFVGRSQKDDEPVPPSPVLSEWIDLLNGSLLCEEDPALTGSGDESGVVRQERLNGFSDFYFREGFGTSPIWHEVAAKIQSDDGAAGLLCSRPVPSPDDHFITMTINQLERFFKHPVKYFLRERIGISAERREGETGEEFESLLLDRHALFERILGWKVSGVKDDEAGRILLRSGILPEGWPGVQTAGELRRAVDETFREVNKRAGSVVFRRHEIDFRLGVTSMRGECHSWSDVKHLQVIPSGISGRHLLPCWIQHLALSIQGGYPEAGMEMLFGARDRRHIWMRFRPVENPKDHLASLIRFYREGIERPVCLLPNSSYVYTKHLQKEGSLAALKRAVTEWVGSDFTFGECQDEWYSLLFGEKRELTGDLLEEFREVSPDIFRPLVEHLEEGYE